MLLRLPLVLSSILSSQMTVQTRFTKASSLSRAELIATKSTIMVDFRKGFTLMELLVVLAIISILSALTLPSLMSVLQTRNFSQNLVQLSEVLEIARSEAVARDTYVWVVVQKTTDNGRSGLQVVALASIDGTGNNTTSTNLTGLTKVTLLPGITLCSWTSLKEATQGVSTNYFSVPFSPLSLANDTNGISFQAGSTSFTQKTSITFTPRGEALLDGTVSLTTGYDPYIDVSLQITHGTQVAANAQDASIVIDGSTGATQIVRLP
jgi:prepilin-type N-terminal cleavage/methylation domain-containing protein